MPSSAWFNDARFGMFVHLGLYSVPGGMWKGSRITHSYAEWLQASEHIPRPEYRRLMADFALARFDADAWIAEAKNAGMRYFIITAKHHEGFALWPTAVSDYHVMNTPCRRDLLGELRAACDRHGLRFGLYYSHWQDWDGSGGDVCETYMVNHEYVRPTDAQFEGYWQRKCLPQVRELIERYDPALLWFDSWGEGSGRYITDRRQEELIGLIRRHGPDCLVNSRIRYDAPAAAVDLLSMMDNQFPEQRFAKPWETSGTLNHSWAYHRLDYGWKPVPELLRCLIGNACFGGSYQLNVGPTGDGVFQPAANRRLRELGAWLAVNGESIYGTEAGPVGKADWGGSTLRREATGGSIVYLHPSAATAEQVIVLDGIAAAPASATVIESGQPVPCTLTDGRLQVRLPAASASLANPVVRLAFPAGHA